MAKRMLIDAAHPEETRVVVLNGHRLEEFDFETSTKKQIKGNIYLAKITRVEPSLQAAFVEYGGNRHGFLAFNEIHPDYYRIPVSDRRGEDRGFPGQGDSDDRPHDDGAEMQERSEFAAEDSAQAGDTGEMAPPQPEADRALPAEAHGGDVVYESRGPAEQTDHPGAPEMAGELPPTEGQEHLHHRDS
ncbi:MAG TPA: ribonuclease E/G, partial [Stellaceae bacterium]